MSMSAPGPYAPGIIADQQPWSRPARRPALFLWATFVAALSNPSSLWLPHARLILMQERGLSHLTTFTMVMSLSSVLVLLWAYLGDRVPVLGARREGHLMVATLVTAAGWLGAAFAPSYAAVLAVSLVLALGMAMQRPAIDGALVEIGQRRGSTRLLAAASVGLAGAGDLVLVPLQVVLIMLPTGWTAGLGAGLALSVFGIIVSLADGDEPPPAAAADPPAGRPRIRLGAYLGSRAFWATLAVGLCARLGATPRSLAALAMAGKHGIDPSAATRASLWAAGAMIAAAAVYALLGRALAPRRLLRLSLAALALGNVALVLLRGATSGWLPEAATLVQAFGVGLATVAGVDLAMRAAPRGREAFGYVLLTGAPAFVASGITNVVGARIVIAAPALLAPATVAATAAALIGVLAVSLVPSDLTAWRRREPG
jgi:hypothetical protein